jgi:hypothetical protein
MTERGLGLKVFSLCYFSLARCVSSWRLQALDDEDLRPLWDSL